MHEYEDGRKSKNPYFHERARGPQEDPNKERKQLLAEKDALMINQREFEERLAHLEDQHKIIEHRGKSPDTVIHYPAVNKPKQNFSQNDDPRLTFELTAPILNINEAKMKAHDEIVRPGIHWHYWICQKCGNETYYNAEWGGKLSICPNIIEESKKLQSKLNIYKEKEKTIIIPAKIRPPTPPVPVKNQASFFQESFMMGHPEDFNPYESKASIGNSEIPNDDILGNSFQRSQVGLNESQHLPSEVKNDDRPPEEAKKKEEVGKNNENKKKKGGCFIF